MEGGARPLAGLRAELEDDPMTTAQTITDIEAWNDSLAREHDIDDYYERSSPLIRWFERRRLTHIRRMIAATSNDKILEVGCGGGHVLRMFPDSDLTGVDVSGEMLAKARRNLQGLRVKLLKGELHELDLKAASFDKIICTEVLEHVVDPESILEQIRVLLAPGGRAVVTIPNDHLINGLKSIVRKSGLALIPPFRRISWGGDHYHLHVWRTDEMRRLLARFFDVETIRYAPCRALPIRICYQCRPK